ncbi:AsmA family protein [Hydrogenophaga sp.]|uniref:AsmA family protein n=1 Tax=Hydrogenophaga sp. TaxID=1904254 RepID=UPI0025BBCA67|nr:AsmA family protein [Hydrogenophaga sp.]MBT9464081.1 AsmA family protein [Hydrogenophaga sp.]
MNANPVTAPASPRLTRRARVALAVGGVLGLVLLGVVWGEVSGWPVLRQPMERAMTRSAGVPVQLEGAVKLHLLWRPRLEVDHLRIASDERFKVPHLMDAQRVTLAWTWGDVWRWRQGDQLRVQALRAGELDAHLVRLEDGVANWQLGAPTAPKDPDAPLGLPRFGSLITDRGRITWTDAVQDVDLKVAVQGREGDALQGAASGYVATFNGRYQALPLKLQVEAGSTLPLLQDADATTAAPWVPMRVEGSVGSSRLLFDGQAAALLGTPRLEGKLQFKGRSLADVGDPLGVTLPRTPPFDLRGTLAHEGGAWRLQASSAAIGSSRLAGDLLFDRRVKPAKLSGRLTGSKLAFADLGPAIGTQGSTAAEPDTTPPGRVLPQRRFDLPSLKVMDADVQVNIDVVDFGTPAMAPMKALQTRLQLDGGVLRLGALQAAVSGGSIKGSTQLDANASPAAWAAELDFTGIDMAGWVPGMSTSEASATPPAPKGAATLKRERNQARKGGDQAVKSYLTGQLFGRVNVRGAGRSTGEILASLDGPVHLSLRDGTLSHLATEAMGLDVAESLGVLIRGDQPLPLRCARFDLTARNGVLTPTLAVIDSADSTIRITGQVSLRDESLALRFVTRSHDWSPLSLRTPVTVAGTLGDPQVGIEAKGLVGRVLGAVALGVAVGPAAALLPLVERGSTNAVDPCTVAAAPAKAAPAKPAAPPSGQKP